MPRRRILARAGRLHAEPDAGADRGTRARTRRAKRSTSALVEEGIEIGKKMMAEMIATYKAPASAGAKTAAATTPAPASGNGNGRGYLNEVSPLTARD